MSATVPSANRSGDLGQYIDQQLLRARQSLKTTDVLTAAALLGAAVVGYVLLFIVLDQMIPGGLPSGLRWALLIAWIGGVLAWTWWSLILPAWRALNRLYVARELERAEPGLKSNLLNLVDLQQAGRTVDPAVLRAIERQTATKLSTLDLQQAIDHRPFIRSAYLLVGLLAVLAFYAMLSPKRLGPTLLRMIPFADVQASTRTQILRVDPGDTQTISGRPLEVLVDLAGEMPKSATLLFTTDDLQYRDEALELRPESEQGQRYRGMLPAEAVRQSLSYTIEAGDSRSRAYRVTVHQPPSATVEQVVITPPGYTKLEPVTVTGGAITAWEGSDVALHGGVNREVARAKIELLDEERKATGEELPLTVVEGRKLTANWAMKLRGDGSHAPNYRLQVETEQGETDPAPTVYPLTIRADKPPEVALLDPTEPQVVPANAVIPLMIAARDVDFSLTSVQIRVEKSGETIYLENLFTGEQREFSKQHDFALERLGLKAGDQIQLWVEAVDNRQPRANRTNSPRLAITVQEPVSRQEAGEQLASAKAEQQKRLDEARQEQNETGEERPPMDAGMPEFPPPANAGEETTPTENPAEKPEEAPEGTSEKEGKNGETGDNQDAGANAKDGNPKDVGTEGDKGERPLSPAGEDDADVLKFLNEQLNPEKEPPASPDRPSPSEPGAEGNKPKGDSEKNPSSPGADDMPSPMPSDMPEGDKPPSDKPKDGTTKPMPGEPSETPNSKPNDSTAKPPAERPMPSEEPSGDMPPMPGEKDDTPPAPSKDNQRPGDKTPEQNPGKTPEPGPGKTPEPGAGKKPMPEPGDMPPGEKPDGSPDGMPQADKPNIPSEPGAKPDPNANGGKPDDATKPDGMNGTGEKGMGTKGSQAQDPNSKSPEQPGAEGEKTPAGPKEDGTDPKPGSNSDKPGTPDGRKPPMSDQPQAKGKQPPQEGSEPTGTTTSRREAMDDQKPTENPTDKGSNKSKPSERPNSEAPSGADEANPREGKANQKSRKPDSGETGRSQSASEGETGSQERGPGDDAGKGSMKSSDKKTGSETKGSEDSGKDGTGQPNEGDKGADKDQDKPSSNSEDPSAKSEGGGKGEEGQGGGMPKDRSAPKPGDDGKKGSSEGEGSEKGQGGKDGGAKGEGGKPMPGEAGGDSPSNEPAKGEGTSGGTQSAAPKSGGQPGASSSGNGSGAGPAIAEEARLEHNREAANLVLKKLQDQLERGEVDQSLLDKLGWTADDMRKFAERLRNQLDEPLEETPIDAARRLQFEEMLKRLDLDRRSSVRRSEEGPSRNVRQIESRRLPVPGAYRDQYEAFSRELSRQAPPAK
jgi:hypothetical protein